MVANTTTSESDAQLVVASHITGTDVVLGPGEVASSIDAQLVQGGHVIGTVTDQDGQTLGAIG